MKFNLKDVRPAGYTYLLENLGLNGIPTWHQSSVSHLSINHTQIEDNRVHDIFRAQHWPGDTLCEHLEFALKYDGINLALLSQIFEHLSAQQLADYIQSKPTGKQVRRLWFLYEFLTGQLLPIEDISTGNYIDVLETDTYFTLNHGERSQRHRVSNNLLGPRDFCPIVRKTKKLVELDPIEIRKRCDQIIFQYPPELLRRALSFLYSKETKSSFAIENVRANAARTEKFIAALELAEKDDFVDKKRLVELQNLIVDPRFADKDYRTGQNYVGQTVAFQKEIIHYICPRPDDLPNLMSGLFNCHRRMKSGGVSPIVHAAVIAYGFVFLHPFEDGNGRIHRFLIHNIMAQLGMIPKGLMFPVSAVMLKNPAAYDASLEAFSKPLAQIINYELDELGLMTIEQKTAHWYQSIDMTAQAEALADFVSQTIDEELVNELRFLANYDDTKRALQEIIDMPDRLIDLFIQLCLQNNGRLSARKKAAHFSFLTDEELAAMELAVQNGYQ